MMLLMYAFILPVSLIVSKRVSGEGKRVLRPITSSTLPDNLYSRPIDYSQRE